MAGKTCVICGAPSGMYPLCKTHFTMKNEGKVIKCETCGTWHETTTPCKCSPAIEKNFKYKELPSDGFETCVICNKKTNGYAFCRSCWGKYSEEEMLDILNNRKAPNSIVSQTNEPHIPCLFCGNDAGNKHFCPSCYNKHKDHCLIVRIENCSDIIIEEKYAEGKIYIAKDGHRVRSQQEVIIDNELFSRKIFHTYETDWFVDEQKYGVAKICPDFHLIDDDIYIEHLGYKKTKEYREQNEFKKKIYKAEGKTVIYTYSEDITNFSAKIEFLLNKCKKGEINNWKGFDSEDGIDNNFIDNLPF